MVESVVPRKDRIASAREIAVLYWQSELASALARYSPIDARFKQGQGTLTREAWSSLIELHWTSRIKILDAREHLIDADRSSYAVRPDGVLASLDMYFADLPDHFRQ